MSHVTDIVKQLRQMEEFYLGKQDYWVVQEAARLLEKLSEEAGTAKDRIQELEKEVQNWESEDYDRQMSEDLADGE